MLRSFKRFWVLALLASSIIWAGAFTLLGPYDTNYQVPAIGYNLPTDSGGPMNLGEEYRWTVPVITYGFDQSFLDYFGSNGVRAVEQAISILNGTNTFQNFTNLTALTGPYSAMSSDLSEFPQNSQRVHLQARALGLLDLKSTTLSLLLEELGLAEPERFTWTLRSRITDAVSTNYNVIQRNFDPVTSEPSSFVNGTLYTYRVFDPVSLFTGSTSDTYSDAIEFPADPDAFANTAVAANRLLTGGYYTGLTRDDVGGLRYLYRKENRNVERLLGDMDLAVTNSTPTNLTLFDLTLFLNRTALGTTNGTTNTPAQLVVLYPGLIITSNNVRLANVTVTNISSFFTNFPVGPPTRVSVTNFTTNIVQVFDYLSFGNIKTNSLFAQGFVVDQTVTVTTREDFVPGFGSFVTNVTLNVVPSPSVSSFINGDFYIVPNTLLDFFVGSTQVVQVVTATNIVSSDFGNLFAFTNRSQMVPIFTGDLAQLTRDSYGTLLDGTQLRALYPNILITRTNSRLTNIIITNYVGANVFLSNQLARVFDYKYGNVLTNIRVANPVVTRQTVEIVPAGPLPGPGGALRVTNLISSVTVPDTNSVGVTNVQGEFFIVPTNLVGYVNALAESDVLFAGPPLFFDVTSVTNIVFTNANAVFTNRAAPTNLVTTNLHLFTERARTNTTAAFLALYPGVLISQTNSSFTTQVTPIVTTYLTNFPWSPFGTLTLASNVTFLTNVVQIFAYTFANVVTNNYFGNTTTNPPYTSGFVTTQGFNVVADPFAPFGSLGRTNFFSSTAVATTNPDGTPFIDGHIYIVPANLFGFDIVATQLVTLTTTTNFVSATTVTNGSVVSTNSRTDRVTYSTNFFFTAFPIEFLNPTNVGLTGFGRRDENVRFVTNRVFAAYEIELLTTPGSLGPGLGSRREIITFSTNAILTVFPIVFQNQAANNLAATLRQGVDKITFQRVNFDSLLGQTFVPVTNIFPTQLVVTNSQVVTQYLRRVVRQPDILFMADDAAFFSGGFPVPVTRTLATTWINNDLINGQSTLAGPGVIDPFTSQKRIVFNKVGVTYLNRGNTPFLDETTATRGFIWASFDGSTNAPIIYPSGTSIQALEQQVLTGP